MKDYYKMICIIIIAIIFTIIINIVTLLTLNNSINNIKIEYLNQLPLEYENKEVQDESKETEEKNKCNEINHQKSFNCEQSIGRIKIQKINFEGQIYEGTSLDVLAKGVGHFDNSPYLEGNVCLAAHNTSKFWAKLNALKKGDLITYESFLGTKEYKVSEITQIEETDWAKLENTDENMLTLITCVKGRKPMRLCVRAIEN